MDWGWTPTADLPYAVHLAGAVNDLYARLTVHAPPRDATGVARRLWEYRRRAPAARRGVAAGPFLSRNLRRAQRTRRKTEARKRNARLDASRFRKQATSTKRPAEEATQAPFMSSWFAAKKPSSARAPEPTSRPSVPSQTPRAVRLRPPPRI
ncbi:unnamed protein product (mitochondrion) [Plasmodiophora brassicae]|uniref:Uncharacterized protein n=1 Tax=Plasmodiophora brassicae TaxID=37360 RepID=A0A3P3YLX9_PLABS|nr:unnamed protein product [Plasmodiophora brassicae]